MLFLQCVISVGLSRLHWKCILMNPNIFLAFCQLLHLNLLWHYNNSISNHEGAVYDSTEKQCFNDLLRSGNHYCILVYLAKRDTRVYLMHALHFNIRFRKELKFYSYLILWLCSNVTWIRKFRVRLMPTYQIRSFSWGKPWILHSPPSFWQLMAAQCNFE